MECLEVLGDASVAVTHHWVTVGAFAAHHLNFGSSAPLLEVCHYPALYRAVADRFQLQHLAPVTPLQGLLTLAEAITHDLRACRDALAAVDLQRAFCTAQHRARTSMELNTNEGDKLLILERVVLAGEECVWVSPSPVRCQP